VPLRKEESEMAGYLIAMIEVTDPDQYRKYIAETPGVIARFGGKFIARGGDKVTLEGPEENRRIALVEFPSLERAKEFYNSPEYRAVRQIREGAATVSIIAVEGV
jgi:uncharacterized protein (DUF1330 family)